MLALVLVLKWLYTRISTSWTEIATQAFVAPAALLFLLTLTQALSCERCACRNKLLLNKMMPALLKYPLLQPLINNGSVQTVCVYQGSIADLQQQYR